MLTQEEILEGNKLCAEFLGGMYSEHAEAWGFGNAKNIGSKMFQEVMYHNIIQAERFEKELKFHSDWNWLMEIVEKIEKTSAWVNIKGCAVDISTISNTSAKTKIEATFIAVVNFIKWYNENNK